MKMVESRRDGRAARAAVGAVALLLAAGCAPGTMLDPGRVSPQVAEQEREGLVAASAVNEIVRPERREFTEERLRQLRVPAGFRIEVFAQGLENPRVIRAAADGSVYVAERTEGRVRLLRDTSGDGRADVTRVVAEGLGEELSGVHGLAIHQGQLYMVTEQELYRAPIQADGGLGERQLLWGGIPAGGQHPNRTIEFGPDGMLYLSIGSTCNACPEPIEMHATLVRMRPDGSERAIFARGLRNTIGFGWHPVSGHLYGLDHNSDGRGNLRPPEELNHIREGVHYGWPWCWGDRVVDPFIPADPPEQSRAAFCAGTEGTVLEYHAHAAPMQMVYYTGTAFPAEFRNDAFATMRGSWNRNPPIGYEVVRIRFDAAGTPTAVEPFIGGWLIEGGRAHFGRLMGLAQLPDGSLLVGDDSNGIVYRVTYQGG